SHLSRAYPASPASLGPPLDKEDSVKRTTIATTLGAALSLVAFVGAAQARNMHCAGGIQYVVQGMNDKTRGSLDDYKREMTKAVQQLEQCASEDSADYEAMG